MVLCNALVAAAAAAVVVVVVVVVVMVVRVVRVNRQKADSRSFRESTAFLFRACADQPLPEQDEMKVAVVVVAAQASLWTIPHVWFGWRCSLLL
jgi:hypothetical protein